MQEKVAFSKKMTDEVDAYISHFPPFFGTQ
jgi:hypothetical protein